MPEPSGRVIMQVEVPTLTATTRLPGCCTRHGVTAVDRIPMVIPSPTPRTRYHEAGAGVVSLVGGVARAKAALRVTRVDGWPMCVRCRRRHRVLQSLTRLMFWGGLTALLVGFLIPLTTGRTDLVFLVSILGGLAVMLVSAVPLTLCQPARIAGLQTLPDGSAVRCTNPHPEFSRQMHEILGERWATASG